LIVTPQQKERVSQELEINFKSLLGNSINFIRLQTYARVLDSLSESYEIYSQPKSVTYFLNTCVSTIGSSVCLYSFFI